MPSDVVVMLGYLFAGVLVGLVAWALDRSIDGR